MLAAYHDLEFQGYPLEYESVLVAIEDASLKSLMVTLYEQAQVKQKFVKDSPEQRLRVLTQRMGRVWRSSSAADNSCNSRMEVSTMK